jgi:hypothetical protein
VASAVKPDCSNDSDLEALGNGNRAHKLPLVMDCWHAAVPSL